MVTDKALIHVNKRLMIFFVVIMAAITQAALVLYTPSFVKISQYFQTSNAEMKTTITAYLLGFGLSQLIYGPLSDRIGRKKPLLAGMLLLSLGCLWSLTTSSYEGFLLSRVIQGMGAGSCMSLSRSVLQDCFKGSEYVKMASYLSSGFAVGLGVTPIIGAYLAIYFPWQSEFVFLFICSVSLFFMFLFYLPETAVIPNKTEKGNTFTIRIIKLSGKALRDKKFILYLFGGVMAYGILIAYNTMAPFLFQETLGHKGMYFAWITFSLSIAYYLGTSLNRKFVATLGIKKMMNIGLILIILSGLVMLSCNIIFNTINTYCILIPLLTATLGQALIWSNCIAAALEDLAAISGTASALFSGLQMLISAAVSAVIALLPESNQVPLSVVIIVLGGISWGSLYWAAL